MAEQYRGNLAVDILQEMKRASQGQDLTVTREQWLDRFGLSGEQRDGKTLMERLIAGKGLFAKARVLLKDVDPTLESMTGLLGKLASNEANSQEEKLAENLSQIAVRQIQREGDICPGANFLAVATFVLRPNFFPSEIHEDMQMRAQALREALSE